MKCLIARLLLTPFLCLLAVGLTGCGGPSTPAELPDAGDLARSDVPVDGDWLMGHLDAEPAMLSPILDMTDGGGRYLSTYVNDTLLKIDNETLEFKPNLAESYEISDDHLAYTFQLRKDVKFSDGVPLTAHDVKFTLDLINDPATDAPSLRNYFNDVTEIEIVSDYTVRFHCSKPYFRHLLVFGDMQVMPKHIYSVGDINKHPGNRAPVGSGPYMFESWDTGQQITLVRNELYWGERPHLDKHVYKLIADDNAAFQVLERGEVDMLMRVNPELWASRASRPEFEERFYKLTPASPIPGYIGRYGYIGWNTRNPRFADKRVRRAMTMLLDRQLVLDEFFMGLGRLISGDTSPSQEEYNQDIAPWPFDPDAAKVLLDEAGWIDRDKDGVREKDGLDLSFEFSFASQVPQYEQMATVYQEELTRAGVGMRARPLEWASFQERVHNRNFDACMLAWLTTIAPDPYQLWHSSQAESGSNYTGFNNAETDSLIEQIRVDFDEAKRATLYHRFHEILHEEQPYTFLFERNGLIAVDKRFRDVKVYVPGLDPREWWVSKQLQRYP